MFFKISIMQYKNLLLFFALVVSSQIFANPSEKEKQLMGVVGNNKLFSDTYWLEQKSDHAWGEWDKVALIFGWLGNDRQCNDLKSNLEQLYPLYKQLYRCVPIE